MTFEIDVTKDSHLDARALIGLSDPAARLRIERGIVERLGERREMLLRCLHADGPPIYGASTGVGAMKTYRVPEAAVRGFNRRLVRDHATGFGPLLRSEVARLALGIRIIELAQGGSGISPAVFAVLLAVYNAGLAPVMPALGSVGEADITLLAHLALSVQGKGRVWRADGRIVSAGRALKAAGIVPAKLEMRDGLALIGSNACMAAVVVTDLSDFRRIRDAAVLVTGLSWVAWRANPTALREEVLDLVSPQAAEMGQAIWSWIADTAVDPRDIQDPLSWRSAPHVLGVAEQAARELASAVERMVWAARDNPVVLGGGDVVSNGNFDATDVALRIDGLRGAVLRIMAQQAQRTAKLLNHHYSGLTPGLAAQYGDAGLGLLDFNVSALMVEAQAMAQGPLLQWGEVAEGIEDYGSMASVAAVRLLHLLDLWQTMTATEWAVAARAVRLQDMAVRGTLADYLLECPGGTPPYEQVRRLEERIAKGIVSPRGFAPNALSLSDESP